MHKKFKQALAGAALSIAAVLAVTSVAFAGVGGSVVPDYPSPVTVGQNGLAATLTITNGSTAGNVSENVAVSNISHAPSCASTLNSTCQGADADPGVFVVHNGTGRVGTACAGTTFTAGAPDANGNIIFTPSAPVVLGPASGPIAAAQCIIDFTVDVAKVPTKDASAAAGRQTDELGSAQFLAQTSQLSGSGSGSTETTVNKVSPTIATLLSNLGPVTTGTSVHDSATLSGATANAGGSVTYTVYNDSACSLGAQSAGTKTVTNGVVPDSDSVVFNTAGTFNWQAVYSGDANNNGATSTCQTETLVVNQQQLQPTVSTVLSSTSVNVGASVHDTATLSGATATAGGTATYTVFTNSACTTGAQSAGTKVVTNGIIPNSNALVFNTPGTFYWQVVYSGDAGNLAATSTCTEEVLVVNQPQGLQYCSPGYWKQPHHFDSYPAPYSPNTLFSSIFANAFPGKTLVQVLSSGGGGLTAYGRHTVAALLNAGALNSGLTPAQVISAFNATFAGAPSGKAANGYYGGANPEFAAPENCPLN